MFTVNIGILKELKAFVSNLIKDPALLKEYCTRPLPHKDFSRNRSLNFERLVLFIARLGKKTLCVELEDFFTELQFPQSRPAPCCTASAFCQQRKKLSARFFEDWNSVLCKTFYALTPQPQIRRFKGLRVIAADGSSVALVSTPQLQKHFGGQSNQQGPFCAAKTFYYYDVLNNLIVDATIAPYRTSELSIAQARIKDLPADTITVYDRNFDSFKMMALHGWGTAPKPFVIRLKASLSLTAAFVASGLEEKIVDYYPPNQKAVEDLRQAGYKDTDRECPVRLRLVRITLPTGTVEVLATNLMGGNEGFTISDLDRIYQMRWGVETAISVQKNILMLESFSGLLPHTVEQDFFATVLVGNLQACLIKEAQQELDADQEPGGPKEHYRYPLQVNRNTSAGKLRRMLVFLFIAEDPLKILRILHGYCLKHALPVRKGRSFERRRKNRKNNSKHKTATNYKRI